MTKTLFLILVVLLNIFLLIKFDFYSKFFKIEDEPDNVRKIHKKNTKVLGGTIILINLIFYALFFLIVDKEYLELIHDSQKNFIIFIITALSMYTIGLLDDKKNLNALNKLIFTTIIISISLFFNKKLITEINLSFVEQSFFLNQFSFLFTLFCYIIFINAFNFLDGINLQIGLYSSFIIFVMISYGLDLTFSYSLLLGLFVYIYFNFKDQIFLGDNGCLLLSYIFAYFFIDLFNDGKIFFSDSILLILLVPGLEIFRLSVERIGNNKSILNADRRHIHHIVKFKNDKFKNILLIQALLILPFLISINFDNKIFIILCSTIAYFLVIIYFKKNAKV